MSTSAPFDTLKFVEKLEAGGFTHAQAKAFAEATSQELATKTDVASVRSDIEIAKRDLEIWFGSVMVVAVGVILAAIRYLPLGGN
jgi:hypothetical protein